MNVGDWIQVGLGIVTLLAAASALWIGSRDRRASAQQARLAFELETAQRLVEVLARPAPLRGFQTDDDGRNAEVMALTATLGERRVPHLWHRLFKDRPTPPGSTWKPTMKDMFSRPNDSRDEAITALEGIVAELQRAEGRRPRRRRGR